MMALFRNPAFTRLFLANFASQLGTVVGTMAFAFYLLDRYSSQPVYATIAELMYAVPTLLVFFIVGVAADRLDRKRIAANSDWIRAGLTALLLLAVSQNWIVPAFVILFARSAVSKFFTPAEAGLLQGILSQEQYMQASGLQQTVVGLFMLFGMGLGAFSYRVFGIEGAVIADGISFLISGSLIASCRFDTEVRRPNGEAKREHFRLKAITANFAEGVTYIGRHKLLLALISGHFLFGFVNGGFAVLPLFTMKYKLSPEQYETYSPLIMVFLGIGFLVGSGIGAALAKKWPPHVILISGLLLAGAMIIALGFADGVWWYLAMVLVTGCILAPVNVALGGWLPELVEPAKMGRVNALIDPLMMLAQSLSLGMIALAFPAWIGVETLYAVLGACVLAACLYYFLVMPALVRKEKTAKNGGVTAY